VTDTAVEIIEADDPELLVVNYANPDMVGHTGDIAAATTAVEAVDEQLGRLTDVIEAADGHLIVTADHGNADDMGTEDDPHTAHTFNPVPAVYISPDGDDGGQGMRSGGALCDLAPTLLELMELPTPTEMTGESLLTDDA
jgi:phosphoglycerate mutase (EC 5.4.2.1)